MIVAKNKLGKIFPNFDCLMQFLAKRKSKPCLHFNKFPIYCSFSFTALPFLRLINQKEQFSYKIQA